MAEQVLGVYPCMVKKQAAQLFITTDRIIIHPSGASVDDAEVILLESVTGHILNKAKPGLPPEQQKTLIKVFYQLKTKSQQSEVVVDLTGDDRFVNLVSCDDLLRTHAGDKAEQRRLEVTKEQERQTLVRQRFLNENTDLLRRFHYLTTEGGLTAEEFWGQHEDALTLMSEDTHEESAAIPVPLRRPDMLQSEVPVTVTVVSDRKELNVTKEKAEEIFAQFPKAKELFEHLVPTVIPEKSFWRRFFHSQYFNLSQGVNVSGGGKQDPYFDVLLTNAQTSQDTKAGSLPIDPEIDLTCDFLVSDESVFTYREHRKEEGQHQAHGTLVARFNRAGTSSVPKQNSPEDEVSSLITRRKLIEADEQNDPIRQELSEENLEKAVAVTKGEIEKLRRTRSKRSFHEAPYQFAKGDEMQLNMNSGRATEALLHLTQELLVPTNSSAAVSRKAKKLDSTPEAVEVNECIDRALELLKFFYGTRLQDTEKRDKVISNLDKLRSQIGLMSSRLRSHADWSSSLIAVQSMISHAEVTHATLSVPERSFKSQ